MQSKSYVLKIYDTELVGFRVNVDEYGRLNAIIDGIDESKRHLFPLQLIEGTTSESILLWMQARTIPKNRQFVEQILATAGLKQADTLGIIDVCKGLSVNDSYWLDDGSKELSFDDINLFDNPLDEALALVAYTGHASSQHRKIGLSPEWTTNGRFPKAWRRIGGHLFLSKTGLERIDNAGMEPYSEYFAAQVAESFGIKHVPYDLQAWEEKLASVCPLLNSKDISFVPFWAATNQSCFPSTLAVAHAFSQEAFQNLRSMLVFDALICNPDRHAANYGILRDNRTGATIGIAPLFDHNLSLFAQDVSTDFSQLQERANKTYAPAGSRLSFIGASQVVMGDIQHEQLRKMVGFEFKNHPIYPVLQKRLDALNGYITLRIRELLEIPTVDERKLACSMERELASLSEFIPLLL